MGKALVTGGLFEENWSVRANPGAHSVVFEPLQSALAVTAKLGLQGLKNFLTVTNSHGVKAKAHDSNDGVYHPIGPGGLGPHRRAHPSGFLDGAPFLPNTSFAS